jgi:acetyl esterase/lipase
MKNRLLLVILLYITVFSLFAQEFQLPLYTGEIPNSKISETKEKIKKENGITLISNVQEPNISVFLPSKRFATGQAIVICPGGGYWVEAYDLEGTDIAKYLNSIGVAAVVLKYRLPTSGNTIEPHKAPMMDAQRAMRLVRANAKNWNIEPDKIGIMGFSAGGHLASTLGTHNDEGNKNSKDSIEQQSCRPDFMVLMYPVISFVDSCVHIGSRSALFGKNQTEELIKFYSSELNVTKDTPPTFFALADDDNTVSAENALLFYKALRKNNVSAELHILSEGKHGFGLSLNNEHVASWTTNLKLWLNALNKQK